MAVAQRLTERVREIMATTFAMSTSDIPDDMSQENSARWSSLYHIMLLLALEEDFNTSFSMDEMVSMTSLPNILGVLSQHGVAVN